MHWSVNNLYGMGISQFTCSWFGMEKTQAQINEGSIKKCDKYSDDCQEIKIDVKFRKKLHKLHKTVPL